MADVIADLIARLRAQLRQQGIDARLDEIERQVRREWGGQQNWVQQGRSLERTLRDAQIVDALRRGESAKSVARRYGLTARRVRQIGRIFD